MSTLERELPEILRAGTLRFIDQYGEALAERLQPAIPAMDQETRGASTELERSIRRKFLQADQLWEKFFWARLAHHHRFDELPLIEAIQRADEDLLGLSATLHTL